MAPRFTAFLAVLLALAGCASGPATHSPRSTLAAFQTAARGDDTAALYALLPEQARREESLAHFQARLRVEQAEVRELGTAVQQGLDEHRDPVLAVPLRSGGSVAVVEDADGWRLAQPAFGPTLAPTPADAARALRAALVRQSMPALLEILSVRARGALQAEIAAIVDALESPGDLDSPVTSPDGQRREFHLPDGRTLVLVREGHNWRVDNVQ